MASLNPYLYFNGNAEEAFNFYRSVFGGDFLMIQRFKDMPGGKVAEADLSKILHIALPIGEGNVLMGNDFLESMDQKLITGNNFYISVDAESEEEADRLFNGLAAGGTVQVPLEKAFWGAYFGMLADRFGIHWMMNYDYNRKK